MHFLGGENDWLLTSLSHTIYFCIFFHCADGTVQRRALDCNCKLGGSRTRRKRCNCLCRLSASGILFRERLVRRSAWTFYRNRHPRFPCQPSRTEPLPADAYLTNGSGYVATVWTERHRWVVIASRKELAEGIAIAEKYAEHNSRVVKSQNGWVRCSARAARSFRHR